jgi:ABC-type nitrate/sulfonate/bicarbonate transport system substrate-binding protein
VSRLEPIRAGFIPLTDAAALIAAADRGFAAEEGIALELVRDVSWANVRDRLLLGDFQVAHLLAPVAIAATCGLGYPPIPITVAAGLGLNGSSIIVSNELFAAIRAATDGDIDDPAESGAALAKVITARRHAGRGKLTFAMVFPFSTHNYLLRFWMAAAGIDPDEDVDLFVVPPPYMVDSLARGHVAGFCVGAPWPSLGVAAGLGRILHFGCDIVATCPDKVLAARSEWERRNPDVHQRLLRAVIRAGAWCAAPEHRQQLSEMLAEPNRLGVSSAVIRHALDGRLIVAADGLTRENPHYFWLDPEPAMRPNPAHALWLYAQMVRWRQAPLNDRFAEAARGVYRPDLFDQALRSLGDRAVAPDGLGAFAGPPFDPLHMDAYLSSWPIGARG